MATEHSTHSLSASPARSPVSSNESEDASNSNNDDLRFNTTPNQLTLARIIFVPIVVALLYLRTPTWDLVAAIVFCIASITDWFDGYIARRNKEVTLYGKLMDPLADKFLVACSLIMLQELGRVPAYVVMLLICREIAITGLRALASAEGLIIASSDAAKVKTTMQMIAIPFLMLGVDYWGLPIRTLGLICLAISLAISMWSMVSYLMGFFRSISEKRRLRKFAKMIARNEKKAEKKAKKKSRGRPQSPL